MAGLIQFLLDLPEYLAQLLIIDRLDEIFIDLTAHGLTRVFKFLITGQQHDLHPRIKRSDLLRNLKPGHLVHADVCQQDVCTVAFQILHHVGPIFKNRGDLKAHGLPVVPESKSRADQRLIVRNNDLVHLILPTQSSVSFVRSCVIYYSMFICEREASFLIQM